MSSSNINIVSIQFTFLISIIIFIYRPSIFLKALSVTATLQLTRIVFWNSSYGTSKSLFSVYGLTRQHRLQNIFVAISFYLFLAVLPWFVIWIVSFVSEIFFRHSAGFLERRVYGYETRLIPFITLILLLTHLFLLAIDVVFPKVSVSFSLC